MGNTAYKERPPANRPAARRAWDAFLQREASPQERFVYGIMGLSGVATGDGIEAPRNRTPKEMNYRHLSYWVWVMEFTDGEYEEIAASEIRK